MRNSGGFQKVQEKMDRSIAAVLALGEEIVISGEIWTLYPLTGAEGAELRLWMKKNPAPVVPPEIKALIDASDEKDDFVPPPTLLEVFSDFSGQMEQWTQALLFFCLWLSLRKGCLTPEEIRQCQATKEWPMSENDVRLLISVDQLSKITDRVFRFLGIRIFGFGAEKKILEDQEKVRSGGGGLGGAFLSGESEVGNERSGDSGGDIVATEGPE